MSVIGPCGALAHAFVGNDDDGVGRQLRQIELAPRKFRFGAATRDDIDDAGGDVSRHR